MASEGIQGLLAVEIEEACGRPRVDAEMRALIRRFNEENPLWSAERIRDHLKLLGFDPPSSNTIRKYMKRPLSRPGQRQAWFTFLRNHMSETWAIDFFTVPTLTFRMLRVFVILDHDRRRVVHFNVTEHPTMGWAIQQLREAMGSDQQPRFVVRDNDQIYGSGVPAFLKACHVQE